MYICIYLEIQGPFCFGVEGFPQRNKGQMGSGYMIYELFSVMYAYCVWICFFCIIIISLYIYILTYLHAYLYICMIMIIMYIYDYSYIKCWISQQKHASIWVDEIPWDEIHLPNLFMLRCYYSILPQWNVHIELYIQHGPIRSMYGAMLTFMWFILR